MKLVLLFSLMTFSIAISANTSNKYKYINDVASSATKADFKDIQKLMKTMPTMAPSHKYPKTGVQVFKITKVIKGSIFEKAGFKVGDLVINGSSPK